MVFIIAGATASDRNTVSKLLAETLGWEFVDAEKLRSSGNLNAPRPSTSADNAGPTLRVETLSAAIHFWVYEWRDVVVSCPKLTDKDRRELSQTSSLVRIVCLEEFHAAKRTGIPDRSAAFVSSPIHARWDAGCDCERDVLTLDSSRRVEETIAQMTALLTRSSSPGSRN